VRKSKIIAASGGVFMLSTLALTGTSTTFAATPATSDVSVASEVGGRLNPLNNSGVTGSAEIEVKNGLLDVDVNASGLLAGSPHAQHIHFGAQARNECPTIADDTNGDFRLTTAEGLPAYGPIKKSLTTSGDTSPASALAVDRFPTAPQGVINYDRSMRTGDALARAIKNGKGVIVVHGVDYNNNGVYDFASAGKSELDPSLPAEATDPATCGLLR
jgi:hypothetical protein